MYVFLTLQAVHTAHKLWLTECISFQIFQAKMLTLSLLAVAKQIAPCDSTMNKEISLSGHTMGFHPQTQNLELLYMSP